MIAILYNGLVHDDGLTVKHNGFVYLQLSSVVWFLDAVCT